MDYLERKRRTDRKIKQRVEREKDFLFFNNEKQKRFDELEKKKHKFRKWSGQCNCHNCIASRYYSKKERKKYLEKKYEKLQ